MSILRISRFSISKLSIDRFQAPRRLDTAMVTVIECTSHFKIILENKADIIREFLELI